MQQDCLYSKTNLVYAPDPCHSAIVLVKENDVNGTLSSLATLISLYAQLLYDTDKRKIKHGDYITLLY
jgi:hypothetical protein